jgi:hypothetical protein
MASSPTATAGRQTDNENNESMGLMATSTTVSPTDVGDDWLARNNDVEPDKEEEEEEEEWGRGSFFDNLLLIDSEEIEYAADDDTTADAADDAYDANDAGSVDDDIVSVDNSVPEPPVIKRKRRTYGSIKNTVKQKGKMQGTQIYQRVLTPDRKRKKKRARIIPDVDNDRNSQQYARQRHHGVSQLETKHIRPV